MLKIKIDNGKCDIAFQGEIEEVAAEMAIAMGSIYSAIAQEDPRGAEYFRIDLLRLMVSDSPAWQEKDGMIITYLPEKEKGGA